MNFFENLQIERKRLGLSQADIASKCGISTRAYSYYEKGERNPDSLFLQSFMEIGGDIIFLFTGQRNSNSLSDVEKMALTAFNSLEDKRKLEAIAFMAGLQSNSNQGISQVASGNNNNQQLITGNVGEVVGIKK